MPTKTSYIFDQRNTPYGKSWGAPVPADDHVHPGATVPFAHDRGHASSDHPRDAAANHAAPCDRATASNGTATATDRAADSQADEAAAYRATAHRTTTKWCGAAGQVATRARRSWRRRRLRRARRGATT